MNEDEHFTEDGVIDDALGDNPRASQLRLMRAALEERRAAFRKELDDAPEAPKLPRKWRKGLPNRLDRVQVLSRIKALDKQIEALRQEEGISEFVETSVRVVLSKAALDEEG